MSSTDETALIEKLRRIEALHESATTDREARLAELQASDPPSRTSSRCLIRGRVRSSTPWHGDLGCCRTDTAARSSRPSYSRVSRRFVDQTLWPELSAMSKELRRYL
jgi:hypothetical protein